MEPSDAHNYGPKCRLAPVLEPKPEDHLHGIPPIKAQYFYQSPVPIDDPFSAATIATSTDVKSAKRLLRPFSLGDNNTLERAWLSLVCDDDRRNHDHARRNQDPSPSLVSRNIQMLDSIVDDLVSKHREKHAHEGRPRESLQVPTAESLSLTEEPVCCPELPVDASTQLRETFCEVTRKRQHSLDQAVVVQRVMAQLQKERAALDAAGPRTVPRTNESATSAISATAATADDFVIPGLSTSTRARASSLASTPTGSNLGSAEMQAKRLSAGTPPQADNVASNLAARSAQGAGTSLPVRPSIIDDGMSTRPFPRVDGANNDLGPSSRAENAVSEGRDREMNFSRGGGDRTIRKKGSDATETPSRKKHEKSVVVVPVGISRLHMVSLPALQMKPIYWSPVNDIAIVSRATWFYRDTMTPVEPPVANQLETGYRDLRPWTRTWQDEVRCAVDVGALGEEKVSYPLWPKATAPRRNGKDVEEPEPSISSDPFCAARCFRGEAAAEGTLQPAHPGGHAASPNAPSSSRSYAAYHVIYKDARRAFLLKPSLKPSAYYGRKPVAKITRDVTIGIPVTRGFDREAWYNIHEKKISPTLGNPPAKSHSRGRQDDQSSDNCPGCQAEKARGQVTDLVLVAHGIGQKFAERVESFHFTHAVTAFRRSINIEFGTEAVKSILQDKHNGIMVLPVNWRHSLSLEDGGPMREEDKAVSTTDSFSLKDIEPDTIPAVRSMISDVMFDIPFYMSQHKPKMIQALVGEANRVYRLWCRNNPGFPRNGRVHLIAHSLGSVMAIEILSKQPTKVPPANLGQAVPETRFFEFDTTNLFLLGSPASFFLLLERGSLVPRRGRLKPGADHTDVVAKDVVGEAGVFGCLAVDNIYNILAKEDPIAYLLNGTIDSVYAAGLRTAYVPSAATSWLRSMGEAISGLVPGSTAPSELAASALVKPPTNRLPCQLELEVHDFTREEVAERKAFLLNDNGQIDYYLRSGGGPLEIQYLNMLSAHTSYWTNHDLIRLLCMEIGRQPGRAFTLPGMRAVKATRRPAPVRR